MEKSLHTERIQERLSERGLSASSLAAELGLSRAAVSKWFTGKSFPRPAELLKLGKALGLSFKEMVVSSEASPAPLVAFRKRAGTITTETHTEKAQEMGRLLEALVPYLGHDPFVTPGRLKNPQLDYEYIQGLVERVRLELQLDPAKPIDFGDLIERFNQLQAVIVPVMWGRRSGHANALHLYLPGTQTTWILLNLDSELHDFKFWMAHELGHVLSVSLLEKGDVPMAEDFADTFAGALLFPRPAAEKWLPVYQRAKSPPQKVRVLMQAATDYVISPFSVYKELGKLSEATSRPFVALADSFLHGAISTFNKEHETISQLLFDGEKPSADHYMRKALEVFETPVFSALGRFVADSGASESVISRMLDIPLVDAKELKKALV